MESPKSRAHKEKRTSYRRIKHGNKKFYDSKAWRETREAYMRHYRQRLYDGLTKEPMGRYMDTEIFLTAHQVTYILQLGYLPCEICLKLYISDAYDTVEKGVELDHIMPVNPGNALEPWIENEFGTLMACGDPFSFENLQLLCRFHHAKKSQRERRKK